MKEYGRVDADVVAQLERICGRENVSTTEADLIAFGRDKISEPQFASRADVVVKPASTAEVVSIVRLARLIRIPVVARGGGSGLSGGAVPVLGGIVVAFERMNRLLEIDTENLVAVAQPGLVTRELDNSLAPHGLFFAGYPMSEEVCQLGGNVAENAGGGRAVKYGVTRDYVLGLEVVTATGDVLRLGGKRIKDVTGYDLIHMFVGSEGTLGLITEITLRLLPRPNVRSLVLGFLPDERKLEQIVPQLLREMGERPSSIEIADATCMRLMRESARRWEWIPKDSSMLLVEFDGSSIGKVEAHRDAAAAVLETAGVLELRRSSNSSDFEQLWALRKQVPWAILRYSPYSSMEDISVPVAATSSLISATRMLGAKFGLEIANFGHAGDGNIHCTPLKPDAMSEARWHELISELLRDLYAEALEMGGTISGEHGIGHKRREFLPLVLGPAELNAFRAVKLAFDPDEILNPGKIV